VNGSLSLKHLLFCHIPHSTKQKASCIMAAPFAITYFESDNRPGGNPPPTRVGPPTRLETGLVNPAPGRVGAVPGLTPTRPQAGSGLGLGPGRVDANPTRGRFAPQPESRPGWCQPGLGLGRPTRLKTHPGPNPGQNPGRPTRVLIWAGPRLGLGPGWRQPGLRF